eukprot:8262811-Alexandrium_andersonii.AAC.1
MCIRDSPWQLLVVLRVRLRCKAAVLHSACGARALAPRPGAMLKLSGRAPPQHCLVAKRSFDFNETGTKGRGNM